MHKKWRENATGCANRHNASRQSRIRQPRRITTVVVQLAQVLDDSTVICKLLGFVDHPVVSSVSQTHPYVRGGWAVELKPSTRCDSVQATLSFQMIQYIRPPAKSLCSCVKRNYVVVECGNQMGSNRLGRSATAALSVRRYQGILRVSKLVVLSFRVSRNIRLQ